ncbi:response regulator [Paenibacillus sp. HWE-109]|uniref:LytR/AlgR family response regulator transcription factor n=1 Tax=Paenibacillus sp. HWE-109 TaxID=1306526 RepID=UPI001EDD9B25|nr:response regulator [Paenibacillus sp. HWE-109]UKS25928.1 response regulator [Paenibacillus sp. HWE-109]
MKVVIIDDEKAMHLILRRMLAKVNEVEIVGTFQETSTAFSYVNNHEVDLICIDISMPRESGLDFAKRLRANGHLMRLIFVTSYTEFASSAFDVNAYDYILKPIRSERLVRTVQRAIANGDAYPKLI